MRQASQDSPYRDIRVMNPSRGLNLLVADILANDKEATAGTKNVEYDESGVAQKRPGYTSVGTGLSNPTNGIGQYISEAANYPLSSDAGTVKKYQGGAWSAVSGSVTLDPTANITFTSLFEKTYAWDGILGGTVFDGTTITRPGTMPRAKFSVPYKGYHVASGVAGQPFRLYFAPSAEPSRFTRLNAPSDPDDVGLHNVANVPGATVFSGDDSPRAIDINKNDGQKITGLGFFQDVLIVFKEESIYQLYFNADNGFVVERISSSYGAVCHGAIASVENDCYFLTDKGVYVLGNEPNYYAAIRTNELSSRIKPILQQINKANYEKCRAIYFDDRYFLTVPLGSSGDVNAMIVYDRRYYAWSVWDNINANDMLIFKDKDNDNEKHFYFTDDVEARMNEFTWGAYNDNGEAIEQVFRTKAFEAKEVDVEKYWFTIRPIFRQANGEVIISYITENGSAGKPVRLDTSVSGGLGTDQLGALLFGTSQEDTYTLADLGLTGIEEEDDANSSVTDTSHNVFDVGINLDSRTLKVEFKNDKINETFALLGFVIFYQMKDPQRFDGNNMIR